jgi:hypothetical protein
MGDGSGKSGDASGVHPSSGDGSVARFPPFASPDLAEITGDLPATDAQRVFRLHAVYDAKICKTWRAYVSRVEEILRPIPAERASHVARANATIQEARNHLKRLISESNEAVRSAWQRGGSALGVKLPALPDPEAFPDQSPSKDVKGDGNYLSLLKQANKVSASFGWVWPALFIFPPLVAAVLWFAVGVIAAAAGTAWALVGVVLLRLHARAQARSVFLRLANSVGRHQAASLRDFALA